MNLHSKIQHEFAANADELFQGATFMADDDPIKIDALFERVWTNRYTAFVTIYGEVMKLVPSLCEKTGFADAAYEVLTQSSADRRRLIDDPVFLIWQNRTLRATQAVLTGKTKRTTRLKECLDEFSSMRVRFDERKGPSVAKLSGTDILIQRFDIDPLIASAASPSYEFSSTKGRERELERQGYSLMFFKDVVSIAMRRMRETWPENYEQFIRLVKVIGYVPDADFRSCSASRYTGGILLAAKDNSVLDIEESLVHEGGHQLLYYICEAGLITKRNIPVNKQYKLPWSGLYRDFYGYFHAFFIYVLLVKYFQRVKSRTEDEQQRVAKRTSYILDGLIKALPDFDRSKYFSAPGRELYKNLAREVGEIERKLRRDAA